MPERILEAAQALRLEASELRVEVKTLKRWMLWLVIASAIAYISFIGVAGLAFYNWRARTNEDRHHTEEEQARCVQSNESRRALQAAFVADHHALDDLLTKFVTSDDGRKFVVQLEATHARVERLLADQLPQVDCS